MAASRMDDYRAPTAVALCGAIVLSTEQAHAVWDKYEAVFIDVLPQPPRPVRLPGIDDLAAAASESPGTGSPDRAALGLRHWTTHP